MLPSGHFAVGYLTTRLTIFSLLPVFPQANSERFWVFGVIAAIAVDLDELYAFAKIGRPIASIKEINHRKFVTHAPLLHLLIGIVGWTLGAIFGSSDLQLYSILYFIGMWTHFVFDSFGYGLMWLWPFTKTIYSFYNREVDFELPASTVLGYWGKFLTRYIKDPVFYIEVGVILIAIFIGFNIF